MTAIKLSAVPQGLFGIIGHVGVGHVHSHSGFVQDDSAGFAVAAQLLKHAVPVDTVIASVSGETDGRITVQTAGGGSGAVTARRGLTPSEIKLLNGAVGQDAVFTQNVAVNTFGRLYGQGVMETAAALQGAAALAVIDTFCHSPSAGVFKLMQNKLPGKYDTALAAVIDIDDIPTALLLMINGTDGGIGPDEDYEGNTDWQEKGQVMQAVGLDKILTIIVESKAFIPALAKSVPQNMYMVRAQSDVDGTAVAEALYNAGLSLKLPIRLENQLMPIQEGSLAAATRSFAVKIIETAEKLKAAQTAYEKVHLTADLARLVSEDAGGVTFMSDRVHDKVRGAGIVPDGRSAVLSMLTTAAYQKYWKIPVLEQDDIDGYISIIAAAIHRLNSKV